VYTLVAKCVNPLNAELIPVCHLLVLLGAHHILHVSRVRVNGEIKGMLLNSLVNKCHAMHVLLETLLKLRRWEFEHEKKNVI
jgi:hypothetical protein